MKKSNNTIGTIIIVSILAFVCMKVFEIEFNMHNIKMMLVIVVASVIGIMLLISLPSKHHESHSDYYERERLRQEQEQQELAYQSQGNQTQVNTSPVTTTQYEDRYPQNNQPEPDNRYNQYHQPYQNPYQQNNPPEEDNRWS